MLVIINSVFPVFLLIFLGWLCVKIKLFKKEHSAIFNNFAYYIALPLLIFQSLSKIPFDNIIKSQFVFANLAAILLIAALVYGLGLILRLNKRSLGIFVVACFLGNVAFIGIPFNFLLLGEEAAALASLNAALVTLLALTLGLYLIEKGRPVVKGKMGWWIILLKLITRPIVMAVVAGLFFSFLKLSLPVALARSVELIATSTSAVALFAVGIFLFGSSLKERLGGALFLSFGSLILMPAVAWLVSGFFALNKMELTVTLLQAGMPLATMNFILAHQFHVEEKTIANAIMVSTVLSVVTLPVLLWLMV